MTSRNGDGASIEQLRLGAGFAESERADIVRRLRKLDRRLQRFGADAVELQLAVKGRDTNEQQVTLEARVPGFDRLVVTSRHGQLKDALNEVRDQLLRSLDGKLGRRAATRKH